MFASKNFSNIRQGYRSQSGINTLAYLPFMKGQSFITPIPGCLTMGKNKTAPSDVDSPRRLNHSEQQQQQQVKIIGYQAE
jgi:hypothetical protein